MGWGGLRRIKRQLSTFALSTYGKGVKTNSCSNHSYPSWVGMMVLGAVERERSPREDHSGLAHLCLFLKTLAKRPRSAC